ATSTSTGPRTPKASWAPPPQQRRLPIQTLTSRLSLLTGQNHNKYPHFASDWICSVEKSALPLAAEAGGEMSACHVWEQVYGRQPHSGLQEPDPAAMARVVGGQPLADVRSGGHGDQPASRPGALLHQ